MFRIKGGIIMLDVVKEIMMDIVGFEEGEILLESHLYHDLDLDSLDMSQILLGLENHYKISIENEEIKTVETVSELIHILKVKV